MKQLVERLGGTKSAGLVVGLGGAIVLLLIVAVIGAISISNDDDELTATGERQEQGSVAPGDTTATVPGQEAGEEPGSTAQREGAAAEAGGGASEGSAPGSGAEGETTGGGAPEALPSEPGADRTGVSPASIRWGFHAPKTTDGAPLNLAEDPLHGVDLYLEYVNQEKVNGRTIEKVFADDRYTVSGGRQAADALINDGKVFFAEGTLGIDQIAQVAAEAKKRGVPYLAGGGSENTLTGFGMYQILATYDDALVALAQFLDKETERKDSPYFGLTKIGVSQLDSPHIDGSVESFGKALKERGMELVAVVKIQKPTEQTTYANQILELKSKGAEIVVPAQDPISTSRMTAECRAQACDFKWTSSNFAHESDVALTLMQGSWTGYRALGGGCYYTVPDAQAADVAKCGMLKTARDLWIKSEGQESFNKDGQGGLAGYQFVHAWLKALKEAGPDPTRERFRAALNNYENYNDLITSSITFKGRSNYIEGYQYQVILQATDQPGPEGSDQRFTWKQISPGFVDFNRY
jgi:ABC-type branched-subunit amino acid transport system substrate-binding protein